MTFDNFWKLYPRRVAKMDALRAWGKLTDEQRETAINAVPAHVRYWDACGTEKQYMPHPATWLNGHRFEDEIEMPKLEKAVAWWASDKGVLAKGQELGINPRPGEEMNQFKERVVNAMRKVA